MNFAVARKVPRTRTARQLWLLAWLLLILLSRASAAPLTNTRVLTVEGTNFWIFPTGSPGSHPAQTNETLQPHDRGRTDERSRGTLQLFDRSVVRIAERCEFEIPPPPG